MGEINDLSQCPFCGGTMEYGYIHNISTMHASYWMPEGKDTSPPILTRKYIEQNGGFVLGETTKRMLIRRGRPKGYLCRQCKILITPHCGV